jgi:zinc finger CCHC domain-containing protein 8
MNLLHMHLHGVRRYFTSMDGAADNSEAVLGDTTAQPTADGEAVPGQLSAELRAALGISESAPPPWLARMRRLGYPPGYMAPDAEPTADTGATGVADRHWSLFTVLQH